MESPQLRRLMQQLSPTSSRDSPIPRRKLGEEVRAAQGQAVANALNAGAAAKRKEEEEAIRQARVNREIEADLLATPAHAPGPTAPSDTPFAYGDSEDEVRPEVGFTGVHHGEGSTRLVRVDDRCPVLTAGPADGTAIPDAAIKPDAGGNRGIPGWARHPHRYFFHNRIWLLQPTRDVLVVRRRRVLDVH